MSAINKNFHENFLRKEQHKLPSEKSFGLVMSAFFLILTFLPTLRQHQVAWHFFVVSLFFLFSGLFFSSILIMPNLMWYKFGLFLHKLVSPVILFIMFYFVFVPVGLLIRLCRKDLLSLAWSKQNTYWITSPTIETSMKDQF